MNMAIFTDPAKHADAINWSAQAVATVIFRPKRSAIHEFKIHPKMPPT